MKKQELAKIMRRAWAIARSTGKAFAVALSRSWQLYRLTKLMHVSIVRFAYEKVDGTLRKAVGTLKDTAALVKGTGCPDDGRTVKYYDIEADGWRSFKVENFISIF